jgi:hypothetical protein
MNNRAMLEERVATLTGLLTAPQGQLGHAGGPLVQRLIANWEVERRLLERILADSPCDDVRTTLAAWLERTAAFMSSSGAESPSWTDRHGNRWDACQVLALLDDIRERLDTCEEPDAPSDDEEE